VTDDAHGCDHLTSKLRHEKGEKPQSLISDYYRKLGPYIYVEVSLKVKCSIETESEFFVDLK
jgi:hypothetical protein